MGTKKNWVLLDHLTKIQSQPLTRDELQYAIDKLNPSTDYLRYFIWTEGWSHWRSLDSAYKYNDTDLIFPQKYSTQEPPSYESIQQSVKAQNLNHTTHSEQTQLIEKSAHEEAPVIQINEDQYQQPEESAQAESSTDPHTMVNTQEDKDLFLGKTEGKQDFKSDEVSKTSDPAADLAAFTPQYKKRAQRHDLKIEVVLHSKNNKTFRTYSKNISMSGTLIEDHTPFDFLGYPIELVVVNRKAKVQGHSHVQLKAEVIVDGKNDRIKFVNVTDQQKQKLADLLDDYIKESDAKKEKAG